MGHGRTGEAVTVKIGDLQASAQADAQGKWMVKLPAMKAVPNGGADHQRQEYATIQNVLVGDVWVCSGQSNME